MTDGMERCRVCLNKRLTGPGGVCDTCLEKLGGADR